MLATGRLPSSLSGIEALNFISHWKKIKVAMGDIRNWKNVGFPITQRLTAYAKAREKYMELGRPQNVAVVDELIEKVKKDLDTYWEIQGMIDKYLPDWIKAEQEAEKGSGLGAAIAGIVVSVVAMAALAMVATQGLRVWDTYMKTSTAKKAMDHAVAKDLPASEAAAIIREATKQDPGVLSTVGMGLGIGMLPIALVVGAFLFGPQLLKQFRS